jgi:hypothetical protein
LPAVGAVRCRANVPRGAGGRDDGREPNALHLLPGRQVPASCSSSILREVPAWEDSYFCSRCRHLRRACGVCGLPGGNLPGRIGCERCVRSLPARNIPERDGTGGLSGLPGLRRCESDQSRLHTARVDGCRPVRGGLFARQIQRRHRNDCQMPAAIFLRQRNCP